MKSSASLFRTHSTRTSGACHIRQPHPAVRFSSFVRGLPAAAFFRQFIGDSSNAPRHRGHIHCLTKQQMKGFCWDVVSGYFCRDSCAGFLRERYVADVVASILTSFARSGTPAQLPTLHVRDDVHHTLKAVLRSCRTCLSWAQREDVVPWPPASRGLFPETIPVLLACTRLTGREGRREGEGREGRGGREREGKGEETIKKWWLPHFHVLVRLISTSHLRPQDPCSIPSSKALMTNLCKFVTRRTAIPAYVSLALSTPATHEVSFPLWAHPRGRRG